MTSMTKYMLDRNAVSDGVKVYIEGGKSGAWILTRSMYSKAFEQALDEAQDVIRDNPEADRDELKLKCQCALVADWSFDEDCTEENVREFLDAAPHIAKMVDSAAGDNARFFMKSGKRSSNGQKRKSPSKPKQAKQAAQSATT